MCGEVVDNCLLLVGCLKEFPILKLHSWWSMYMWHCKDLDPIHVGKLKDRWDHAHCH